MGLDICHAKPTLKISSRLEFFTVEELSGNPDYVKKYSHLLTDVEVGDDFKIVKALYFIDVATQRKRMNEHFVNDFENCKVYFDLESVIKASNYLKALDGESQSELEEEFKRNFIDNFIEGESIFYISW